MLPYQVLPGPCQVDFILFRVSFQQPLFDITLPRLKGFHYPREIIAFAVWAYHRFTKSAADVDDSLAERGVFVSRETIRLWVKRFGHRFESCIRRDRPKADHRAYKGWNNGIENSHRLTRKWEKIMGRFKSHRQAQRCLTAHDQINTLLRPRRYQLSAPSYRHARADAFTLWHDYTAEMVA